MRKWVLLCLVIAFSAAPGRAQENSEVLQARAAGRHLTFLELPKRRRAAAQALQNMGVAALPALRRGVLHPSPAVHNACTQILGLLGEAAAPARVEFSKLLSHKDPGRRYAGQWGLDRLSKKSVVVVTESATDAVWELDLSGKVLRKIPCGANIYDADRLPNGRYLVTWLSPSRVREIDAQGKVYWEYKGIKLPLAASRLTNGNTLIAGGSSKRVVEVDPKGKEVWEWRGTNWPNDADRLPCGNTLISDSPGKKIFEVDRSGVVVWSHGDPAGVIDVQRLPNGHTIYTRARYKGVVEIDAKGKELWSFSETRLNCATRLPDGGTIVGGQGAVLRLAPNGKEMWRVQGAKSVKAVQVW